MNSILKKKNVSSATLLSLRPHITLPLSLFSFTSLQEVWFSCTCIVRREYM